MTKISLLTGNKLVQTARPRYLASHADSDNHDGGTCRRHMIVLPGTGRKEFPFPTADQLIAASVQYINNAAQAQRAREALKKAQRQSFAEVEIHPGLADLVLAIKNGDMSIVPKADAFVSSKFGSASKAANVNPNGSTLWAAAGGLASIMYDGRFEAHIADVFDPHIGAVDWARRTMSAKYQPTVESLQEHFDKLVALYRETLPSVMHALQAQYRDAGEDQLINAAVQVINQQLAEILYVLGIWTSSFVQQRDGKYDQLLHVTLLMEQSLRLYAINAQTLHASDVFMPHFTADGPSTIPGARGPVGAHAVQVPHDEREIIALMLPIFGHEFRHDYYADVPGLPEQLAEAVIKAIDAAHAAGKFKFKSDIIKLGEQEVPTIELLKQIFVMTLSETDADLSGGVSQMGKAFGYSMITVFSAFNSRGQDIFKTNALLRNNNRFAISDEGELVLAPHMPDYARAFILADALDLSGCPEDAAEIRALATQAGGVPSPADIVWVNGDRKSKFKFRIRVPLSDLLQVSPVAVDAIINSKLECLDGKSNSDLVNWNLRRQAKVDRLVAVLMDGKGEIPSDMNDVYATYVAAAAITAYWELCKRGERPLLAAAQVEKCARAMLLEVRKYFDAKDAAAADLVATALAALAAPAPAAAATQAEEPKSPKA